MKRTCTVSHKSSNQAKSKPLVVRLEVQGREVQMQIDTGTSVSLISEAIFQDKWRADNLNRPTICPSQTILRTYVGEPVDIVGECEVAVRYGTQKAELTLMVVRSSGPVCWDGIGSEQSG